MASTGKAPPQLLNLPEIAGIQTTHPPIANALKKIVNYINSNVSPVQGTKIATRKNAPGAH
jgi:hypothetical protein